MLEIRFRADYSKGYNKMAFVRECLKLVFHRPNHQMWHLMIGQQNQPRLISGLELEKALLQADVLVHLQIVCPADASTKNDSEFQSLPLASLEVQDGEHFLLQTRLPFFPNALHFLQNNTYDLSIETRR